MISECIFCSSPNFVRNGHDKGGVQRYKCNDCKKRFCEKGIFARMKTPREIIINAIYLRSYPLSFREVKRIINKLKNYRRSHVAIYKWILKFCPKFVEIEKRIPLNFSKIWHVDEKFIKVKGSKDKFAYLWIASDSNNNILAVHVSNARNGKNAKIVLQKARERTGFNPDIIVTDGLQGYKRACRIFGRKCKHVEAHFKKKGFVYQGKIIFLSNNRAERINEYFALWLHVCRGLKSFKTANLMLEFYAMHINYLMPHGRKEEVKIELEKVPMLIEAR